MRFGGYRDSARSSDPICACTTTEISLRCSTRACGPSKLRFRIQFLARSDHPRFAGCLQQSSLHPTLRNCRSRSVAPIRLCHSIRSARTWIDRAWAPAQARSRSGCGSRLNQSPGCQSSMES